MSQNINTFNVVWMLYKEYINKGVKVTNVTEAEKHLKNKIINMLKEYESTMETNDNETLDLDSSNEMIDYEYMSDIAEEDPETILGDELKNNNSEAISLESKQAAVQYWYSSKKKKHRTFLSVQNRFRFVKNLSQLYLWEKQINNLGDNKQKLQEIQKYVFEKFQNARLKCLYVHDFDMKRWAIQKALELQMHFKASNTWLLNFKRKFRIVSRKITKVVSEAYVSKYQHIAHLSKAFVNDIDIFLKDSQYDDSQVFNTDQSSFNKEIHSGRTLSFSGMKDIENVVQSIPATTHSYTIMPTISKDGKLLSPLFIVLAEPKGHFGIHVKKKMYQANNIYAVATKSGKMGSKELHDYLSQVYFKFTPDESVLLVDSWTSYKNNNLIERATPPGKKVQIFIMPPKTTPFIQPLDKFGFRIWKNFVRKLSDLIMTEQININLFQRDNILKLQSIAHNQFSSPRYINMWKYSWYACSYTDKHPGYFPNPNVFIFNAKEIFVCSTKNCVSKQLARCSWCTLCFCVQHYFIDPHICDKFNS